MANTTIPSELIQADVALGGSPTTTTQSAGNNTTKLATTAFVTTAVNNLIASAPGTMDTLNEIAAALNDDPDFTTTVNNAIATKLPLAGGTMTGNIAHASDFTIDAGGDIILDADGADIIFKDGGTSFGKVQNSSTNMIIESLVSDKDIKFLGNDGGSTITALTLDMSAAGAATFNSNISTTGEIIGGLYKVGSTTVIDGSRNLTNIGTIVTSGTASIGTTSTLGTLNVYHSTTPKLSIAYAGNTNNGGSIDFNLISGSVSEPLTTQIKVLDDGGFRQYLTFLTKTSAAENSGMTERMRLKPDGKLGINDTDASQMLSVSGTSSVAPGRFTATGNTNTLEVWGNSTASTSTGLLCNAGTNSNDYSAKFRNYAGSTIMEVRGDSVIDIFGTTRLQDNNVLAFGQSSDCRISYDGTNALNITATAGTATQITITAPQIRPRTDLYVLNNSANNKNQLVAQSGAIKLYYDGGKKLETTSIGVSVSGNVISSSDGGSSSAFFLAGTTAGASSGKVAVGLRDGMIQMRDPADYYHKMWYYDGVNISTNQVHGHFRVFGDSDNSVMTNNSIENTLRLSVDTVNGNIGTSEGGSEILSGSDSRLKTNVQNLPSMLAKINALRPVSFDWKYTAEEEFLYGFIAQEVQAIDSTLIYDYGTTYYRNDKTYAEDKTPDGEIENTLAIYERQLIPMLVKALQEADDKIDALTARLDNAGL